MKILLQIALIFTGISAYAQVSREDYLSDFDYGVQMVEKVPMDEFDIKMNNVII